MTRGLGYLQDAPDSRDLFLAGAPGSLPESCSLREFSCAPFDQGATNSCVAQAVAQALYTEAHARTGTPPPVSSRLWIYWWARQAGKIEGDNGSRIRDAIRALRDLGHPPESRFPFRGEQINLPPSWKLHRFAHDSSGIRSYRRVSSARDVRAAIVAGNPVVAGWQVDEEFMSVHGARNIDSMDGPKVGGHAMTVVGYDGDWFEVINSWGTHWRDAGTCRFSSRLMEKASDAWIIDTV